MILCDHEDPVQVAIPPNPVVIFPPVLPLPAPAPVPPPVPPPAPPPAPPAPLPPLIDPASDTEEEEEDAADISLPTDTDFDFTTASEAESEEADTTVVEREAKTPTNPDADTEGIYAAIGNPFASSSRLQRSPVLDQGARPKGILRLPTSNLSSGPPPRPVSLPPEVEAAAFNPFASSSRVQRSPTRNSSASGSRQSLGPPLTPQEAAQLPKEFQPTAAE